MPTTNNNWPTPVATDLVKDGWEAIKDLGDAIDTTLGVYSPVTPGLVKIASSTFSGVASTSLAASTFTSAYRNYKIIFIVNSVSTTSNVNMRLRTAGTDNSTANYDYQLVTGGVTSTSASANNNGTTFDFVDTTRNEASYAILDILQPQETIQTFLSGITYITDSGSFQKVNAFSGRFQATTSFDSATFITSSGTMTGNYSVYGYNF